MSVIMRNDIEVGGTDDDVIAKVGTAQLTTQADDLSAAVNELNSSLSRKSEVKNTSFQGTTNNNGIVIIPIAIAKLVQILNVAEGNNYYYGFVRKSASNQIVVRVVDDGFNPISNKTVIIEYNYI